MKIRMSIRHPRNLWALLPLFAVLAAGRAAESAPGDTPKLTNAAQSRYGARFRVTTSAGGSRDPQTAPGATFDGNVHTRCVLRGGLPYTFTIELPFRLPVDRIAFAHSDYESERAPKDIEIGLDDSSVLRHTLDLKRPER